MHLQKIGFPSKEEYFAYKLQYSRNITVKKQYCCNIDMTFCKRAFPHWFLQRASAPRKETLHFFEEQPLLLWRNTTLFSITKFTPFWTECRKRCDTFFEECHILSKRVLHTSEALHFTSPPNLESKGSNKFLQIWHFELRNFAINVQFIVFSPSS